MCFARPAGYKTGHSRIDLISDKSIRRNIYVDVENGGASCGACFGAEPHGGGAVPNKARNQFLYKTEAEKLFPKISRELRRPDHQNPFGGAGSECADHVPHAELV